MNKSESISIQKQIKASYHELFPEKGKLLLGVSGGPDSMALLYLFHKNEIPVFVVHVNYGTRGSESDSDQQLVEEVCSMWNIECCSVSLADEESSGNFQDWARKKRYQIFRDLKKEIDAEGIAVAHHADDQLETILFKVLRGSGFCSWKGLQEWDGEIYRPLLNLSKAEILEFCVTEAIPYRIDASNESNDYTRNAMRNDVFPVFDEFIPGWKSNLYDVSHKSTVLEETIGILLKDISEGDSIQINQLQDLSNALKAELIKRFISDKTGISLSKGQLLESVNLLESQTGKESILGEGFSLIRDRNRLVIKKTQPEKVLQISISEGDLEDSFAIEGWNLKISQNEKVADLSLDSNSIVWPIQIRKWESGDKLRPFGMNGMQKVSDHLTNRKINASLREETLILTDSGGTICAILYPETAVNGENGCISDFNKITQSTKTVLSISKN